MKFASITLVVALFCSQPAHAFQVKPDGGNAITEHAVEKKLKTTKPVDTSPMSIDPSRVARAIPPVSERADPGPREYWFHPAIHTFGNGGLFGGLHAAVAPFFTKVIDVSAYDGKPVREAIARDLRRIVGKPNARVADLCCGVGISTRALQHAFLDAETIVGVDTSPQMVEFAKMIRAQETVFTQFARFLGGAFEIGSRAVEDITKRFPTSYKIGNAERTGLKGGSFDLVTIMYGFHEIPFVGRYKILREVRRLLREGATLAVVDISPSYQPSDMMLAGEPYVLEYKKHIQDQLRSIRGFANVRYDEVVPGHVGVWVLTRAIAQKVTVEAAAAKVKELQFM
jgi:ubiquinone/menaquinone biosynthesis C-methylase UbiE